MTMTAVNEEYQKFSNKSLTVNTSETSDDLGLNEFQ